MPRRTVRKMVRDVRGSAALMAAGSLFMLAGAATVSVDLGSIYLARRELQGIADAAAIAAQAGGGRTAAQALIDTSGVTGIGINDIAVGEYRRDRTLAVADRFVVDPMAAGATRIVLERPVPLFFGRLLVGRSSVTVQATATAARQDVAAFSIGTGLAEMSGGIPNALLSALAGTEVNLSVMDYEGLASAQVDLLGFADALAVRLGHEGESHAALFGRDIPLADLIAVLADRVSDGATAARLRELANRVAGRSLALEDLIDLGPFGASDLGRDGDGPVVDALTLLRMLLTPQDGQPTRIDMTLAVPGLLGARLVLATGGGEAHSPQVAVTDDHDVVVRTAQTRLYLESDIASSLSGIVSVRVPLFVELAAAEARLSSIECRAGDPHEGVTLNVTPSVGSAALGDIDVNQLTSFGTPIVPRRATLAAIPTTRITAYSQLALGGASPQPVHFSRADISSARTRTVATDDLTQGLATSLMTNANVQATILGINLNTGPVVSLTGALLATAAPTIDGLLATVGSVMGLKLGKADVRVHQMRCGQSALVA